MTAHPVGRLLVVCALVLLPAIGYAQEAVLTGTVTDSTGAVLPGVSVVAVNDATGNRFEAVTDERGIYRISARVGVYAISSELQGFTTVTRPGVQLLVGQTASVNLQMAPSTVQETVTVTAEAPLLNVSDVQPRRQRRSAAGPGAAGLGPELDGAGAAGARQPHVVDERQLAAARSSRRQSAGIPAEPGWTADFRRTRYRRAAALQPGFDRGVPVHLEPVRRHAGPIDRVQVNAITKSGTNRLSGLFRGNFRDDKFNA